MLARSSTLCRGMGLNTCLSTIVNVSTYVDRYELAEDIQFCTLKPDSNQTTTDVVATGR